MRHALVGNTCDTERFGVSRGASTFPAADGRDRVCVLDLEYGKKAQGSNTGVERLDGCDGSGGADGLQWRSRNFHHLGDVSGGTVIDDTCKLEGHSFRTWTPGWALNGPTMT
jgi:hypothetical protein